MLKRLLWYWKCDRLGPDIPITHVLLYFKQSMRWICKRKFKYFGSNAEFRPFAYAHYASKISIGENVTIHPGTILSADEQESGTIVIEDHVAIGSGVHIYAVNHRYDNPKVTIKCQGYMPAKEVRVCRGSWIGAGSIILPGVVVGRNAVVGAGSIVTKSINPFTVVAGNPARMIKRVK